MTVEKSAHPTSGPAGAGDGGAALRSVDVLKRQVRTLPLVGLIFFSVSGGPFGLEESVSSGGAGMTMLMLLVIPVLFGIPCSLMAAELGSALPVEGGYYYWVKVGLGKFAAFTEGAWQWMNSFLDTALYPIVFADYLANYWGGVSRGRHVWFSFFNGQFSIDTHWVVAVAFMIPLAWLNIRGSRLVGDSSLLLMVVVLLPFAVLSVYGIVHIMQHGTWSDATSPFTLPGQSNFNAFGACLGVVIWNYIGWENPSTVLPEVDEPRRTFRRALMIAIPLITISYVLPMIAALGSGLHKNDADWQDGDFANVARLLAGPWLFWVLSIGVMIAQVGLFSSLLMSGSRVPRVLAADGYLPKWVAKDHPKHKTPAAAIILSCVIFAVFCTMDFSALVDADVLTNMAAILLEFAAFIALRRKLPGMARPYRVPGGMLGAVGLVVFPTVFTIWLAWSSLTQEPAAFWIGIVILVLGLLFYPLAKRTLKKGEADAPVFSDLVDLGPGVDTEQAMRSGLLVAERVPAGA
ncbi:APC family permease [Rudaeicoccus suwonensis]|uniref:Amino acid/polyamine/organocation transporter (APC superfamily) n=1 Tax=Rudaeicoccus suwonensis TaxID=657409 RepID=A0A561E4H5_9MICO|nr:APC family permease [Rudaeicoccus suwonensis]TWE10481.1 amino acid/polyamine/organocation transporter (APC superfamily) [Rudaeicoccus suwonensis]